MANIEKYLTSVLEDRHKSDSNADKERRERFDDLTLVVGILRLKCNSVLVSQRSRYIDNALKYLPNDAPKVIEFNDLGFPDEIIRRVLALLCETNPNVAAIPWAIDSTIEMMKFFVFLSIDEYYLSVDQLFASRVYVSAFTTGADSGLELFRNGLGIEAAILAQAHLFMFDLTVVAILARFLTRMSHLHIPTWMPIATRKVLGLMALDIFKGEPLKLQTCMEVIKRFIPVTPNPPVTDFVKIFRLANEAEANEEK